MHRRPNHLNPRTSLALQVCNAGALRLYQKLGFIRDKRLQRYYLSGSGGCG